MSLGVWIVAGYALLMAALLAGWTWYLAHELATSPWAAPSDTTWREWKWLVLRRQAR